VGEWEKGSNLKMGLGCGLFQAAFEGWIIRQPETFAKPKIKIEIVTPVISA